MSGEELYNMYRTIQRNHSCELDPWRDLDETDRICWCDLANELRDK